MVFSLRVPPTPRDMTMVRKGLHKYGIVSPAGAALERVYRRSLDIFIDSEFS